MLNKEPAPMQSGKSRLFAEKKIFTVIISVIGLITFTYAQGITNTLGGNTATDKFIVENSDLEAGLVVTGERNVGIGTSSPISKLHIYDDVNSSLSLRIQNANTGTGAATKLYFDGSNHAGISVFGPSFSGSENVMRIFNNRNSPDGSIDFVVNGGKKMVIDNTGNVGIGTSNPGANLDANGDVILGDNGTRFLEIREIVGITRSDAGSFTYYNDKLPAGWTGEKTRLLSLEIQYNNATGDWYSIGYTHSNERIAGLFNHAGRDFWVLHPDSEAWRGRTWHAIIMRMP